MLPVAETDGWYGSVVPGFVTFVESIRGSRHSSDDGVAMTCADGGAQGR